MNGLSIGQVARRAGLRPSAIRYYESYGLLPAPVRLNGWRRYGEDIFTALAAIELARHAGFSLGDIRRLLRRSSLRTGARAHWASLARQKLHDIDALIERAGAMKRLLMRSVECGCAEIAACPIVGERVADMRTGRRRGRSRHESLRLAAGR
jgi:MerR family transcriptional regulator, redox-sensitive transcriptional activator SoxR